MVPKAILASVNSAIKTQHWRGSQRIQAWERIGHSVTPTQWVSQVPIYQDKQSFSQEAVGLACGPR